MRAPVDRHTDDEIIADILRIVKVRRLEKNLRKIIERLIAHLRAECPPFAGKRTDNKEYAKDLRRQIDKLKKKLKAAPKPLTVALFRPEFFEALRALKGTAEFNPNTRDYLAASEPMRLTALTMQLDWLRSQCDQVIRNRLGEHGLLLHQKRHAALASHGVLEWIATQTGTKLSLTCSPDSNFCKIASLFFEAATGKHGKKLLRACEAIARDHSSTQND